MRERVNPFLILKGGDYCARKEKGDKEAGNKKEASKKSCKKEKVVFLLLNSKRSGHNVRSFCF